MAVGAAAVEILDGAKRLRLCRVAARDMAGIANTRHARLQQLRVAGAVRLVAVRAVLHYRRVLPEERTAPFGVAAQTVFVGRALQQLLGIGRAVRIMAAGAGYLAFAVRHVRRTLELCTPHLVALQAQLGLRFLYTPVLRERSVVARIGRNCWVQLLFDIVAIYTSQAPGFVRTALPEQVIAARMAVQAGGVLLGNGVIGILAEADGNGVLAAACFNVGFARPMTRFAAASLQRSPGIPQHNLAHDGVLETAFLIDVAGYAGLAAHIVPIRP